MADTFWREPLNHGDANIFHDYVMAQLRRGGLTALSMELLNTGGALHLSAGYCGIDDGTGTGGRGTIIRDADSALSIAGITIGTWASIEASVAGTVVTYHVTDIAGGNDESVIPAAVLSSYDYMKGGYYLIATRRLIGIAFKKSDGSLGRIINCQDGQHGFRSVTEIEYTNSAGVKSYVYLAKKIIEIGPWNMLSVASVNIAHGIADHKKIRHVVAAIRSDDDSYLTSTSELGAATNAGTLVNGSNIVVAAGTGSYRSVAYDDAVMNRGWITIEYET
jgi:hypothetical protein